MICQHVWFYGNFICGNVESGFAMLHWFGYLCFTHFLHLISTWNGEWCGFVIAKPDGLAFTFFLHSSINRKITGCLSSESPSDEWFMLWLRCCSTSEGYFIFQLKLTRCCCSLIFVHLLELLNVLWDPVQLGLC